ncbi:MAG: hypothetical protein LIO75_02665 [Lachnospiraceae bacterium]|nr:hypothetical protein [Lachnospiraceae bacterium]
MTKHLDEALAEYSRSDCYPFHMPGHKRQRLGDGDVRPEEIDITEIDGFDNLHHAEGILKEGQDRLAALFGANESFYLVNGSTAGILAAICGCMTRGGRLLTGRNCHKAVYHAAYLMEAGLEYLYPESAVLRTEGSAEPEPAGIGIQGSSEPESTGAGIQGNAEAELTEPGIRGSSESEPAEFVVQGSIDPEQVRRKLRAFPDIQAVVITSPTYDGIVSDIEVIAAIVHAHGIPFIVDAAHGAHFGFSDNFPKKAIALGADLSVESLHKTLPSYTQTAVLHMKRAAGEGSYRFDPDRVKRYLGIFQTSSPSYILMAGIDRCVRILEDDVRKYRQPEQRQNSLFGAFEDRLERFYRQCGEFQRVKVFPYSLKSAPDMGENDWKRNPGADISSVRSVRFCLGENDQMRNPGADEENNDPEQPVGIFGRDYSKILITASAVGLNGQQLYDLLLRNHHLQMEMAAGSYVIALTTIMDTEEGFCRLCRALREIDCGTAESGSATPRHSVYQALPEIDCGIAAGREIMRDELSPDRVNRLQPVFAGLYRPQTKSAEIACAMDAVKSVIPLSESVNRITGEFVYLYPPGIPILVPGERITQETLELLETCRARGMQLQGMADLSAETIRVVR